MKNLLIMGLLLVTCQSFTLAQSKQVLIPIQNADIYPKGGIINMVKNIPLIFIGSLETNVSSLIMDNDNLRILDTYEKRHFY